MWERVAAMTTLGSARGAAWPRAGAARPRAAAARPKAGPAWQPAEAEVSQEVALRAQMKAPRVTLLITLTGRDRPGVTSRLFSVLAAHPLTVADVEQVVIRGRLVLGVLVSCEGSIDLTAAHQEIMKVAADLGLDAEITIGTGEAADGGRRRGQLHVTVLGSPLLPSAMAAIAGRIAAGGANIDRIGRLARYPVTCIELDVSGADPESLRAGLSAEAVAQQVDVAVQRGGLPHPPAVPPPPRTARHAATPDRRRTRRVRCRSPGSGRAGRSGRCWRRPLRSCPRWPPSQRAAAGFRAQSHAAAPAVGRRRRPRPCQ